MSRVSGVAAAQSSTTSQLGSHSSNETWYLPRTVTRSELKTKLIVSTKWPKVVVAAPKPSLTDSFGVVVVASVTETVTRVGEYSTAYVPKSSTLQPEGRASP